MISWELLGPAALHPDPNKIRGGRPTITADDVRLALAGLRDRAFLFGMAAFLGHRGSLERLEVLLEADLFEMAHAGGWGSKSGELDEKDFITVRRMSGLLLYEVISARSKHDTYAHEERLPNGTATVLCPGCLSKGWRPVEGGRVVCELCRGRGRFLLTDRRRAEMLGVPERTWRRRWSERYAEALSIPQGWEASAIGYVKRRLRDRNAA